MARELVLEQLADGVLTLTWNRPQRKNAFNEQLWRETRDALREARADDRVRTVIVTGAGEAFSAGQDLGEMAAPPRTPDGPAFPSFLDELVLRQAAAGGRQWRRCRNRADDAAPL